jgi:hypothetical protein
MALKIQGNDAVTNTRELDVVGADGVYDDWHPNTTVASPGAAYSINFQNPFHSLSLTASVTFSELNKSVGRSVTIHLDTGTAQYSPSWSGNVKWPGGTEPTWSDNQYWIVNLIVGIGGSIIFGSAQGFEGIPATANWPSGTYTARSGTVNLAAEVNDYSADLPPVSSTARARFRFYRRNGGGSYIEFEPTGTDGGDPNVWWTPSGTQNTIASGADQTFWTETTVNPSHTRIVVKEGATVIDDTGYVSSASVDTGAVESATVNASESGTGSTTNTSTKIVECWARQSGYADTKVSEFKVELTARANGLACFTGEVPLYKWDTSSNSCVITPMSQAYNEWLNREEGETHHVIGQNNNTKEILKFKEFEVTQLIYGINGSDYFVTGGHPFLTTDGWKCCNLETGNQYYENVELTQLVVGDKLLKYDAEYNTYYEQEVLEMTSSLLTKTVYLLDVAGDDTYIADGYIVHNK